MVFRYNMKWIGAIGKLYISMIILTIVKGSLELIQGRKNISYKYAKAIILFKKWSNLPL